MAVIKAENIRFVYGTGTSFEKTALSDVSFEIEKGEFIGIIGHTGSGKSTLVQLLNGLLKPTDGKIYLNGKDIWEQPKKIRNVRFKVGMVFQYPEYQLFDETVYKDISYGPKNMGMSEEEIDEKVRSAAEFVGLKRELLDKSPFELSGGEKRRAAIAGVIAMDPEVLILDEPTAGLDPLGRDALLSQIQDYHDVRKNTVILAKQIELVTLTGVDLVTQQGSIQNSSAPVDTTVTHTPPAQTTAPKVNLSRPTSQPTVAPVQPVAPPPPPAQTASPTLPIADIDWENDFNF